ncbi:MAG: sterol desaturase family protein [Pseudomonadota bacterium]
MQALQSLFAVVFLVSVFSEYRWARRQAHEVYNLRETLSNLSMAVGNGLIKPLTLAWGLLLLSAVESWQIWRLPEGLGSFIVTFVVVDLAYYGYHRASHEVAALWTLHYTHHSSPWMNLTTALRLNWVAKFVSPVFFLPLVLVGFSPIYVSASLALGLLFQFFLHTEAVGKLGRFEGMLLNTPSAHRVHHGANDEYIDRNYAGVFIVWDRLFGTYTPESAPVRYGVTTGFAGHNPFVVQFRPLWQFVRGRWRRERHVRRVPDAPLLP